MVLLGVLQLAFNVIVSLLGILYIFCHYYILNPSEYAFFLAFMKALPIWLSSTICMVNHNSTIGIALLFGSVGDMTLDIRDSKYYSSNSTHRELLFKMAIMFFSIEHCILIIFFLFSFKKLRYYAFFVYIIGIVVLNYESSLIPSNVYNLVLIYGFLLNSVLFCSINALSIGQKQWKLFEIYNIIGSILFVISDAFVSADEFHVVSFTGRQIYWLIMITYYSSQFMFANSTIENFKYQILHRRKQT